MKPEEKLKTEVEVVVKKLFTHLNQLSKEHSASSIYGALVFVLIHTCTNLNIKKKVLVNEIKTLYSGVNKIRVKRALFQHKSKYNPDGSSAIISEDTTNDKIQETSQDGQGDSGIQPT